MSGTTSPGASALYLDRPFFRSRRMAARIRRPMRILGIEAHYPKRNLSRPVPGHEISVDVILLFLLNSSWSEDRIQFNAEGINPGKALPMLQEAGR